ncbi:Dipeptidyl aminopeptidase/acylaminoacyl peptidase [Halopseudomonas xinjiangensis]|uniref:Dipeptidyl aminopeptidase/acylaminoacyl peptidase n=1 Tax=Halopseudomonas xinjiangensis TaxID=487184 RepID=A0A1H1U0W1_9GAMM|nr:S9 family peptidase [Halopseudomonas xinjiangensis]SDS66205.1 Dipeptidyl aminopeptidase/acylaminoacyl peptidase [Halopseudomonas xinjiangensis]
MNAITKPSAVVESYGFWNSDFSAEHAVAGGGDYVDLCCDESRLLWIELLPATGRSVVMQWTEGSGVECLTPEINVRSRVYEYGGGALCLCGDTFAFVSAADQQIHSFCPATRRAQPLTARPGSRYGGLVYDALRNRIIAVEETREAAEVLHRIVSIDLIGHRQVLVEGSDFYNSPTVSDNGRELVWIEWNRPNLPWTRTRLCRARLNTAGGLQRTTTFGTGQNEAYQQPFFDADGTLMCLCDRNGYWQPWLVTAAGDFRRLPSQPGDHAPAPWTLGPRHVMALAKGWLALSWLDSGYGQLAFRHVDSAEERHLAPEYTRFRSLAANSRWLFCVAGSPDCTAAILRVDLQSDDVTVLHRTHSALGEEEIARPQQLRYRSGDGETAHGFFYAPHQSRVRGEEGSTPPLLIFTHGGPTSATYAVLDQRIQFWTQRGFAVADLNYRGSSGYGRAYRNRLQDSWGIVDVEDVLHAVEHLSRAQLIDPDRVFIRGSSAGGYTTLASLVAGGSLFRAGASLYGVSDPLQLRAVTHKFEADYIDWLIGDPQRDPQRYVERSPLQRAQRICTPVIFFQGLDDAVVLPEQTQQMYTALEENGVPVRCLNFEGEGHGFRQPHNQIRVLEEELAFYRARL